MKTIKSNTPGAVLNWIVVCPFTGCECTTDVGGYNEKTDNPRYYFKDNALFLIMTSIHLDDKNVFTFLSINCNWGLLSLFNFVIFGQNNY